MTSRTHKNYTEQALRRIVNEFRMSMTRSLKWALMYLTLVCAMIDLLTLSICYPDELNRLARYIRSRIAWRTRLARSTISEFSKSVYAMGNSSSNDQLGTVQFYNCTPFVLAISIDRRNFFNEPSHSRTTTVEQVSSENPFVEIRAMDVTRTRILKQVSFFTRRHQSWIVSDVEVRLQLIGFPLYVADNWSTETTDDRKHFTWNLASSDTKIYDFVTLRQDNEYFRCTDDKMMTSTNCFSIFNDSPYFLDITVEYRPTGRLSRSSTDKTETRIYRSDPRGSLTSDRLVTIDSADRYPLVRITAVGPHPSGSVKGSNFVGCKQVEMYAKSGTAWIVTDECVSRQAGRNQPPYVASIYDVTRDEVAAAYLARVERWNRADQFKKYEWNLVEIAAGTVSNTAPGTSVQRGQQVGGGGEVAPGLAIREWVSIELSETAETGVVADGGRSAKASHGNSAEIRNAAAIGHCALVQVH